MDRKKIVRITIIRFLSGIPVLSLAFFLPAGTIYYWEAWAYMILLFTPMLFAMQYLIRNNPELLERRMRMKEKEAEQSFIIKLTIVYFIFTFLFPGFDKRFGWSETPLWAAVLAQILVFTGYIVVLFVFRENSYASRTVEVDEGQKVIDTGLYSIIRHPMYLGVSIMYVLSPLALGSLWGLIPSVLILPILVARILNEEKVLEADLPGYTEYKHKVKFRLVPKVW